MKDKTAMWIAALAAAMPVVASILREDGEERNVYPTKKHQHQALIVKKHRKLAKKRATYRSPGPIHPVDGNARRAECTPEPEVFPLFDPKSTCRKCGHEEIGSTYREAIMGWQDLGRRITREEYMERTCRCCGFMWAERTLEQAHDLELLAREAPDAQD